MIVIFYLKHIKGKGISPLLSYFMEIYAMKQSSRLSEYLMKILTLINMAPFIELILFCHAAKN